LCSRLPVLHFAAFPSSLPFLSNVFGLRRRSLATSWPIAGILLCSAEDSALSSLVSRRRGSGSSCPEQRYPLQESLISHGTKASHYHSLRFEHYHCFRLELFSTEVGLDPKPRTSSASCGERLKRFSSSGAGRVHNSAWGGGLCACSRKGCYSFNAFVQGSVL